MKIFAATALVLYLLLTPIGASAADERVTPENITSILPKSEAARPSELDSPTPAASALDLSLFGIISLGVLGLFWIRRHTSEL